MYIAHLERQLLSQITATYYKVRKDGISDKLTTNKNSQKRSPRTFESAQYEPASTKTKVTGKPSKPVSVQLSKNSSTRSIRSNAQKTPATSKSVLGAGAIHTQSQKSTLGSPKPRSGAIDRDWLSPQPAVQQVEVLRSKEIQGSI